MKTKFILVRHGESEANFQRICAGQSDFPLTDLGRRQADAAGETLKNTKIDFVYASDLSRAYETAQRITKHHNLDITKDARIREIHRGIFEGRYLADLEKEYPETYAVLAKNKPFAVIEGGESTEDVQERLMDFFEEIAPNHSGQTVLVAFHATALRYFCAKVMGIEKKDIIATLPLCENAALTYVDYEDGKFTVTKYNDFTHIEKMKSTNTLE